MQKNYIQVKNKKIEDNGQNAGVILRHFDSFDEAMNFAKKYNQHSIYNWATGTLVKNDDYDESTNEI